MDCGTIGGTGHQTIEHIEFADQMTLAHPTDGGIAAHLADILDAERDQSHPSATARRCRSRFRAGMSTTNDENVVHCAPLAHDD